MAKKAEAPAVPVDTNEGMGGSYVVDPETGQRVLQQRTLTTEQAKESEDKNGTAQA